MPNDTQKNEHDLFELFKELSSSTKVILDIISRMDERLKSTNKNQDDVLTKIDRLVQNQNNISERVIILESKNLTLLESRVGETEKKVNDLIINQAHTSNKLGGVLDIVTKLALGVIGAYIIYKLGLK